MTIERLDEFLIRHNISTNLVDNPVLCLLHGIKDDLNMNCGPWVAGGSILAMLDKRGLTGRDVDFFFSSKDQMDQFEAMIKEQVQVKTSVTTDNATTLETRGETLQFIFRRFFTSPFKVLESFDFSVCKFASDGEYIAYTEQSYTDWRDKVLRNESTIKEPNTADRFIKYSNLGYTTETQTLKQLLDWIDEDPFYFTSAPQY